MDERITKLKRQVAELVKWKNQHLTKQVDFPLGVSSQYLVQKNLLVFTEEVGVTISADIWLEIEREGKLFWLAAQQL